MKEKKRTGIPLKEVPSGMVESTVWMNWDPTGGVVLKVNFRRLEGAGEGDTKYRTSFYPEDLEDVARTAIGAAAWIKENAGVLPGLRVNGLNTKPWRVRSAK